MKNIFIWLIIILVILIGGFYALNSYIYNEKQGDGLPDDYKNVTFWISGEPVTLVDGEAQAITALGGESMTTIRYFGNDLTHDIDGDGMDDVVFLITQDAGGSGTFFYAVGALSRADGYIGTHAVYIGDRIAPQTMESGEERQVIVNYADRAPNEPMTERPSVGKSFHLLLDTETLQFGEVAGNFEGEADPSRMTLAMHTWTWVRTQYNNDTEVVPGDANVFTLTLNADGTFSATTDCNSMGGSYKTDGNAITFGPIAMRKKFCEGSQELEFASMLEEARSYLFTSRGELVLELPLDTGSVIFR